MSKKLEVYEYLKKLALDYPEECAVSTAQLAENLKMQRSNVSSLLNELVREKRVEKVKERPVLYKAIGYGEQKTQDTTCFGKLIGNMGILKNEIQLAKAAVLYPDYSLPILVSGEKGTGKGRFVKTIYEFAIEQGRLNENADKITFDCGDYIDANEKMYKDLFGKNGKYEQSMGGMLCIKNVEQMRGEALKKMVAIMEGEESPETIIVGIIEKEQEASNVLQEYFPVKIELPPLQDWSLQERLSLVQKFIYRESMKMQRSIRVNSELLRCLLLYKCNHNIRQLKKDIQIGCANAYVRELEVKDEILHLYLRDFPPYVRKGFLYYEQNHDELRRLVVDRYFYTISYLDNEIHKERVPSRNFHKQTTYDYIRNRAEKMKQQGMDADSISSILSEDLQNQIFAFARQVDEKEMDVESMGVVIDQAIKDAVTDTLKSAEKQFKRTYSVGIYYGLCMHLMNTIKLKTEQIELDAKMNYEIMTEHKEEYRLASELVARIEQEYKIKIPIDEVVFLTLFLTKSNSQNGNMRHPHIMVVMHGDGVATAIMKTVKKITQTDNISAFDLSLDQAPLTFYDPLKNAIQECDNGKGILMIYDMGSIRTMTETIMQETGIDIRFIEAPVTQLVMDCAIRADMYDKISELHKDVKKSFDNYQNQLETRREKGKSLIITLCSSGKGGALAVKKFLMSNLEQFDIEIMNLPANDKEVLRRDIERLKADNDIICVIGAYDPRLFDIHFVSFSQIFEVSADKLPLLLTLDTKKEPKEIDYSAIYHHLKEEMPELDVESIGELLPGIIRKIEKVTDGLSQGQELGLFMHIACSINNLQHEKESTVHPNREQVIKKNKKLYNKLREILQTLESYFAVEFNDNEIANIITIIKQI